MHVGPQSSDLQLARYICAHQRAYCRSVAQSPLFELREDEEIVWISSGAPSFLNGILETRTTTERLGTLIEEAIAYFSARSVKGFVWRVEGDDRPADLREHLLSRGFREITVGPLMALDLDSAELAEDTELLDVRLVNDRRDAEAWADIVTSSYGLPATGRGFHTSWIDSLRGRTSIRSFVGSMHGRPVSSAQTFLHEGAVGLYWVATIPEARRAGHATRITRAALFDAHRAGARMAVLHANDVAIPIYEKLGFRDCGSVKRYVFSLPTSSERGEAASPR